MKLNRVEWLGRVMLVVVLLILTWFWCRACQAASDFCEGFEDGYTAGYCAASDYDCLEPLPPLCPLARPGQDEYGDGYNSGFRQGQRDGPRPEETIE